MVSERTFGIEIECGNKSANYTVIADRIRKATAAGELNSGYTVGCDGSGIEVRTPILQGEEGFAELERIMRWLVGQGCYVSRADGMHTHVGAKEFANDEEACKILMRTWYHNQVHIEKMVSQHRGGSYVCSRVTKNEAENMGQYIAPVKPGYEDDLRRSKFWGPRLRAMGLANVPRRSTIECRLHEGCLDFVKATAWVKFCQAMVDHAVKERTVLTCRSKIQLLNELSLDEDAINILRGRQTLMPRVAGAPAPQWNEPNG